MKKRFSTLTVGIIAFLMLATGVVASEGYRKWAGTDDFRETQENLSNIQTGINTLQGKLETTETELATTKTQLEKVEGDSSTKQETIDDLNEKVTTLEKERTDTIALIKKELQDGITEVNGKNGPKHKYDAVQGIVNKWAVKLFPESETDRLVDHGTSIEYDEMVEDLKDKEQELEDKEQLQANKKEELNKKESALTESNSDLEQAVKDMESLKNQSGKVLESLSTDTEEETKEEEQ